MKNKKEAQSAAEISADDNAQPQQRQTDDGLATVEQNNAADKTPQNVEQQLNAVAEPQASETDQSVDNAQADRTEQAQAVKEKRTAKQ